MPLRTCSSSCGGSCLTRNKPRRIDAPSDGLGGEYSSEMTTKSFEELKNLAFHAKSMGPEFYVIGGWAAWRYHAGLGSRDIDVVFPDHQIMDPFLAKYYKMNDYERYGGPFENRFRKRIGEDEFVQIDAASFADGQPFKEDRRRNLPFELLMSHSDIWNLGESVVRIPKPELLILQKVKAHRDRSWDLGLATTSIQSDWLRGKIRKDEYDIRNIAPFIADWNLVRVISEDCDCSDLIEDSLKALRVKSR